jgi:hypothetical protein
MSLLLLEVEVVQVVLHLEVVVLVELEQLLAYPLYLVKH